MSTEFQEMGDEEQVAVVLDNVCRNSKSVGQIVDCMWSKHFMISWQVLSSMIIIIQYDIVHVAFVFSQFFCLFYYDYYILCMC